MCIPVYIPARNCWCDINKRKYRPAMITYRIYYVCLVLAGISQAVQVYLKPEPALPRDMTPGHASFALSRHLGVDFFESWGTNDKLAGGWMTEESFVGGGSSNGLLLSLNDVEANGAHGTGRHTLPLTHSSTDVLPLIIKPSFRLQTDYPYISSLISTYLHRARHAYSYVYSTSSVQLPPLQLLNLFSVPSPSTDQFLQEIACLSSFLDSLSRSNSEHDNSFAAVDLKGISAIARDFGRTSEQYVLALRTTRALIESALSQPTIHLAILMSPSPVPSPHAKRQHTAPQQPMGSLLQCFPTEAVCDNVTDGCSGRGTCVSATKAGMSCYVCTCQTTVSDQGRGGAWAGEACERKDISGWVQFTMDGPLVSLIMM
jgi:hypothetical protein